MAENSTNRDRRDWTLIIFLLPIGILLMVLAGQFAIRLVPFWRVSGGMGSSLDPESSSGQQQGLIPAISFDILTPMGWLENFLTPGPGSANDGLAFAPFVVFEPSSTPSATAIASASSTPVTPTATPSGTATSTGTGTATSTKKPPSDDDDTPTPPPPPPALCTDPTANNTGSPLPCTYTPVTSTLVGSATATPAEYNDGPPDTTVAGVPDNYYFVINLPTPIVVNGPSETGYYDFVYYERDTGTDVDMDSVILSISMDNSTYYVVFNWGNTQTNDNGNIDVNNLPATPAGCSSAECDNQNIPYTDLHNNTGIAVDVDTASSHPPVGNYSYLAIQAPDAPPGDGNDGADVDSVEVTEVPIP